MTRERFPYLHDLLASTANQDEIEIWESLDSRLTLIPPKLSIRALASVPCIPYCASRCVRVVLEARRRLTDWPIDAAVPGSHAPGAGPSEAARVGEEIASAHMPETSVV